MNLSSELREELMEYSHVVRFPQIGSIFQFLGSQGFMLAVSHCKTYVVPDDYRSFEEISISYPA